MKIINGENIPNLPWKDKPADCRDRCMAQQE